MLVKNREFCKFLNKSKLDGFLPPIECESDIIFDDFVRLKNFKSVSPHFMIKIVAANVNLSVPAYRRSTRQFLTQLMFST